MVFKYANPDAVTLAWVAGLPGFNTSMVGETLPADNTTWAASGFVTPTVYPGRSNMYYRLDSPVVTLQCWYVQPQIGVVPWAEARAIAERIRAATYLNEPRFVTVAYCDENARVLSSYPVGSPRRVLSDLGNYAAYSVDVQLHWVPVPK